MLLVFCCYVVKEKQREANQIIKGRTQMDLLQGWVVGEEDSEK
jgi:hypothetical protein